MLPIKPFAFDMTDEEIEELARESAEILRSGILILGEYGCRFEQAFAECIGVKHAIAVNSGTSALESLLRLKDVTDKTVLVPTNTNFATAAAVLRAGAQVRYLDMDRATFAPTLAMVQEPVERPRRSFQAPIVGVLWVHIGGVISPEFPAVGEYCRRQGLFIFEDVAHAHGSQLGGVKAGNLADAGAFSFFATKVMTTCEGGMITTNSGGDDYLARSFRNQGKRGVNYGSLHHDLGNSWRMTEMNALLGLMQLKKLPHALRKRQAAYERITKALDEAGLHHVSTRHMDAAAILRDLVASALANGVEFDTGVTIENLVLDRFDTTRINSLLCRGQRQMPLHLKAGLFVFTVGAGLEHYPQALRFNARLRVSHSAMVVAWPALSTVNFARMSIKPKFHFNHLRQNGEGKQGPVQFSMLANSGFLNQDAHVAEKVADIDAIRGLPGVCDRIRQAVATSHELGMHATASVTMSRLVDYEALPDFLSSLGFTSVVSSYPLTYLLSNFLGWSDAGLVTHTDDELHEAYENVKRLKKRFRVVNPTLSLDEMQRFVRKEEQRYPCIAGFRFFFLDWHLMLWRCHAWHEPMCSVYEFNRSKLVRDGCTQCTINCYRDTSLMQHIAVSVHDSFQAFRRGRVVEGVKALMQRNGLDSPRAVIEEVPWILRF